MLFKKKFVKPILDGTKTMTRRNWDRPYAKEGYTVSARTDYTKRPTFARLVVTHVYQERLGDISELDAKLEGFGSVAEFFTEYFEINKVPQAKQKIALEQQVYVIIFQVYQNTYERWLNYEKPVDRQRRLVL